MSRCEYRPDAPSCGLFSAVLVLRFAVHWRSLCRNTHCLLYCVGVETWASPKQRPAPSCTPRPEGPAPGMLLLICLQTLCFVPSSGLLGAVTSPVAALVSSVCTVYLHCICALPGAQVGKVSGRRVPAGRLWALWLGTPPLRVPAGPLQENG